MIIPMTYDTFVRRAEKRMLGLREKLKEVPFLKKNGLDAEAFVQPPRPVAADLLAPLAQPSDR